MSLIIIETKIEADIKTCFDLVRDIDFYQNSLKKSNEIAIGGKIKGLVDLNDCITWEANHFGFVRHLVLKVTEFNSPNVFVDEMVQGDYKAYKHEHMFRESGNETVMTDKFFFESPYGIIGKFVNWLFLKRYMTNFLKARNSILKNKAELIQKETQIKKQKRAVKGLSFLH